MAKGDSADFTVIGVQHPNGRFGGPVNTMVSVGATNIKQKF